MIKVISGIVIKGEQIGRKLGFKTANIFLDAGIIPEGVYKINIVINNEVFPGIGTYFENKKVFESHIFDFDMDIYGKNIEVIILNKIRDNKKFNFENDLIQQIKKDIQLVRNMKKIVFTFGTFDLFHEGHKFYLQEARKYGNILHTIVATDTNVEKIKSKKTVENQDIRREKVKSFGISDKVLLGKQENHLDFFQDLENFVVCLGYDQVGFIEELKTYIKKQNKIASIIRIGAFKPEIFKSSLMEHNI